MTKQFCALKRMFLILAILLPISQQALYAQQSTHVISGTVSNEKGEPLEGVVLNVKNSNESVATDAAGQFKITINKPRAILVISHVGYADKEIDVTQNSNN